MIIGIQVDYNRYHAAGYRKGQMELVCENALETMNMDNIKQMAEQHFNENISGCVITVPTMYTPMQRRNLQKQAAEAGLKVVKIMNATSALIVGKEALIPVKEEYPRERVVMSIDLCEEHVEVAIAEINEEIIEVAAVNGEEYSEELSSIEKTESIRRLLLQCVEESGYQGMDMEEVMINGDSKLQSRWYESIVAVAGDKVIHCSDEFALYGTAFLGGITEQKQNMVITEVSSYYIGTICNRLLNGNDCADEFKVHVNKNATFPTRFRDVGRRYEGRSNWEFYLSKDPYGTEKIYLGEASAVMPRTRSGWCEYKTCMFCDADGVLYFEVYIPENNQRYYYVLNAEDSERIYTEDAIREKIEDAYKEEDALLKQAEELYTVCNLKERKSLDDYMEELEEALNQSNKEKIKIAAQNLKIFMERMSR